MTRRPVTLQRRLRRAFVLVALLLLGITTSLGVLLVSRVARSEAENQLRFAVEAGATDIEDTFAELVLNADGTFSYLGPLSDEVADTNEALGTQGGELARIDSNGTLVFIRQPPEGPSPDAGDPSVESQVLAISGVSAEDLDQEMLSAGGTQVGSVGNRIFVATGLSFTDAEQELLFLDDDTIIAVATSDLGPGQLGQLGPPLLAILVVALLVSLATAFVLARQISRPLAEVEEASRAIAAGELSTRLGHRPRADAELQSVMASLDAMAEQLEQSRDAERAFIASVSHDLKTPLTSVSGYAELLADGMIDTADEQHDAARVILREASRLRGMVDDLLSLARLDAHQFSLDPAAHDLMTLVTEAAQSLGPMARHAEVTIEVEGPETAPADVDALRLGQVLRNLGQNAIDFADSSIVLSVEVRGDWATISVSDDGPGLDEADVERLWERFYSNSDAAAGRTGTGVGLAIVAELMAAMGGTATAENRPGGGARFSVGLPVSGRGTEASG